MRRIALAIGLVAAAVAGLAIGPFDGGDDEYLVRGYFDNGAFLVPGEDVRVAGANVGTIESVDVSLPGEVVSEQKGEEAQDGKAVIVMRIDDSAFQDFRADAGCLIRLQSLVGERFVDCRSTLPRSDATDAPPPLERIPEGEPGAGQYRLPVENNGKTVDLDLLNNIYRAPYRERLRLILNDLGAGFAARGEDLAEIVERGNPTLREVNRVLETLADQRRRLARLARDSDEIVEPLSRERARVSGFLEGAGTAAAATAEHRPELEQALAKFPGFLRELRATMGDLEGFADAATPVAHDFGRAAPSLTDATQGLAPFADASTTALRSFGDAAQGSGPKLLEADPIVRRARDLARSGEGPTRNLARFLGSTRRGHRVPIAGTNRKKRVGGFESLMELIYNTTGSANGFDRFGHFLRSSFALTNCTDYNTIRNDSCAADFFGGLDSPVEPRGESTNAGAAAADATAADGRARRTASGGVDAGRKLIDFLMKP